MTLVLSNEEVARLLPMEAAMEALEPSYCDLARGEALRVYPGDWMEKVDTGKCSHQALLNQPTSRHQHALRGRSAHTS